MARQSLYDWCKTNGEWGQQLLNEWVGLDEFGNIIDINKVSYGSGKKVQWRCNKGHRWTATIANRTNRKACPYCIGKKVSDKNSLKTWCQNDGEFGHQLIKEWKGLDENNNSVEINDISYGSHKKVQWKCKEGHEWLAAINNRTRQKQGCPYCSGKRVSDKNSLKTWCQTNGEFGHQLLQEWTGIDENKKKVDISEVAYASTKKVYWKCNQGHKWIVRIANRTNMKSGCPYCYRSVTNKNSLKTWCQNNGAYGHQLLQEWTGIDETGNTINMDEVSYGNSKRVRWKCEEGHEWEAEVAQRTIKKSGCPYCCRVSDKNSLNIWCQNNSDLGQQLLQEWIGIDENNIPININEAAYGSTKKVQWKCIKGHIWTARIANRTINKNGCPYCNTYGTSFPEQFIYHSLRQIYPNTITRGRYKGYEYDITIPELRLCIEYSGLYWHADKITRDEEKKQLCKAHGVKFIQIYAHYGEIQDTEGNVAKDSYTKRQIIYRVNNNKDLHIAQLQQIIKFILEQYDPKHTVDEIKFNKAEIDARAIFRGNIIEEENT